LRPAALEAAAEFITGINAQGITCLATSDDLASLAERVPDADLRELDGEDGSGCELVVVFGGDGNILRAAEWALPRQVPVLGVNLGHVGFLAELESSQVGALIDHVALRDYEVEERMTIDTVVHAERDGEVVWRSFAINEVSVEKLSRERMIEVLVRLDDRPLSRWATDGVLVATPTGSTAYAFSARGPVIWPDLSALLLVPLSAHALFASPLVLGPKTVVSIEVLPGGGPGGVVWCDGRRSTDVVGGMEIVATVGAHRLRLARTSEQPFVNRLVRKFGLPVDGWRGAAERDAAHAR
jgi:NAD+ kinase